ncbi:MAG: hypothetical protein VX913_15155, partial [Planctomycetota bacterium]|nr:hypothetical protein [Planctomycetota bacterium]
MRKWTVLAAILAVAFVVPTSFAQTQEDILTALTALQDRVVKLESENAELKNSVTDQNAQELDSQISALLDRLPQQAGTTVKSGANPVTLSGEFRFRNSWSFGDDTGGNEHDGSWNDALVRLGFQYDFTGDVTAYAELQSQWAFGQGASGTGGSVGNDASNVGLDTYQAWLEVRNVMGQAALRSRTGRQEVVLGNQYQFGNADWYDGWTFDATRWDWENESFSLTAMAAKLSNDGGNDDNQLSNFWDDHDDDELYTLYFTLRTIQDHTLDLYWIYSNGHGDGATGTFSGLTGGNPVSDDFWHTMGARIGGTFADMAGGLNWNLEIAYQFGDSEQPDGAGGQMDHDALAIEAEVGFNVTDGVGVFARVHYAEGQDGDDLGYQQLFGNRHTNGDFRARYGIA